MTHFMASSKDMTTKNMGVGASCFLFLMSVIYGVYKLCIQRGRDKLDPRVRGRAWFIIVLHSFITFFSFMADYVMMHDMDSIWHNVDRCSAAIAYCTLLILWARMSTHLPGMWNIGILMSQVIAVAMLTQSMYWRTQFCEYTNKGKTCVYNTKYTTIQDDDGKYVRMEPNGNFAIYCWLFSVCHCVWHLMAGPAAMAIHYCELNFVDLDVTYLPFIDDCFYSPPPMIDESERMTFSSIRCDESDLSEAEEEEDMSDPGTMV